MIIKETPESTWAVSVDGLAFGECASATEAFVRLQYACARAVQCTGTPKLELSIRWEVRTLAGKQEISALARALDPSPSASHAMN